MRTMPLPALTLTLATAVLAPGLSAQGAAAPRAGSPPPSELAAIRVATEKYKDIDAALADGYVDPLHMCVSAPMEGQPKQLGAMGIHYVRPDLLGITTDQPRVDGTGTNTDFVHPAVLIYEPEADGSMVLVGIENLVWAKAWKDAGNQGPPTFHGNEYYYMEDNPGTAVDEAHGFMPHYELHFWLYRENPAGMFMPWNTAVTCANFHPGKTD